MKHIELLGKDVTVSQATNKSLIGITGECVDETKHTLRFKTNRGEKTVLKSQATFQVGNVQVDGTVLTGRLHERAKKKVTTWQRTRIK